MQSNRRDFIRKAGLASAGLVVLPTIIKASVMGGDGRIAPGDRINMAVIGCGGRANDNMPAFLPQTDVRIVAVCDVDDSHALAAKQLIDKHYNNNDCRMYRDFRELLAKETIDAAVLCLPDHWHALIACAFADKKIHVYGEKPLARSLAESRAIVNAVKRNGITWQTGSQQRSSGEFRHACELVRNGRIGKVDYVEVSLHNGTSYFGNPAVRPVPEGVDWDMWLGPAPLVPYRGVMHGEWRSVSDYGGGQLEDWAGHHIDIANWGLGIDNTGPATIEGTGRSNVDGIYDVPVEYDFTCLYENGLKMRVTSRYRMVEVNPAWTGKDIGIMFHGPKEWIHVSRGRLSASDPEILREPIGRNEIRLYKSDDHYRNFLDCIRSGRETIAPAEAGHRAISVGHLGEIAIRTGQKLHWDPVAEKFTDGNVYATRLLRKPYREPWQFPV
jgi:predicted dehydrogenase